MKKIIYATTNKYKIKEANLALVKYDLETIPTEAKILEIQTLDVKELVKDKAEKYYQKIGKPLIVMDSGLFIEAFKDFPGVYTSFIGQTLGVEGLINLINDLKNPQAYVQRTVAFIDDKETKIFISKGQGVLISEKRGANGFFFDYIFYVPEKKKTLAEMTNNEKVAIWGDAWDQFALWFLQKN